jgi:DNA-binding NtrC family response regulator
MLTQLKVLLADDAGSVFFKHSIERLNLPHNIFYVKNASELFHVLESECNLNLAILDMRMPEKDGIQCLKEMKANGTYKKVPVIIMTNSKNNNDIDEAFQIGAHYYVVKPYSLTNYIETIRFIFNLDWKIEQPIPTKEKFIINLAFV